MDAFISHASKDVLLAARLEKLLEEDGLQVWLDRSEIRLGVLLRDELQAAIKNSRLLILLWSRAAKGSRWVTAELLTAYHLNRFIVPSVIDNTRPPYFLTNTIRLDLRGGETAWVEPLRRAVREAPNEANELPAVIGSQSPELEQTIRSIAQRQAEVTDRLGSGDLQGAQDKQPLVDGLMVNAEKVWRLEPMVLSLAGYHRKNSYLLKHWAAIQAGRPPEDRLLRRAEGFFFETLLVNPNDYSALNGLGSILFLERELDAAEFFIRRAISLADGAGIGYAEAEHDLAMILRFKQQ